MRKIDYQPDWLALLSIFWLVGVLYLVETPTSTLSETQTKTSVQTEMVKLHDSSTPIFADNPILFYYAPDTNWLSFLLVENLYFAPEKITPWPEYSQINAYFNIFTFQHFKSSLRLFPQSN